MNSGSFHKAAVLGAGSWGTALASHLALAGHQTSIWAYEPEVAQAINQTHQNPQFLPGIQLPASLTASHELHSVLAGTDLVLLVMPSHVFRVVLGQAAEHLGEDSILVSCSKGIEVDTGYTMLEVASEVLHRRHHRRLACLSGPSFAREVASQVPTAVAVGSRDQRTAQTVQVAMAAQYFRVYTSPDIVGMEIASAVKNPLAIAAGMLAGLDLGANTQAALVTRGLAEMTRLAVAKGGQPFTLSGLAGMGDLVLTCYGQLSRNRTVGFRLAGGETIDQITSSMKMVAEGVINTKTVMEVARRLEVEMPIIQAVHEIIYEGKTPLQGLQDLMARELKAENYSY